jgi:hypothetical protein
MLFSTQMSAGLATVQRQPFNMDEAPTATWHALATCFSNVVVPMPMACMTEVSSSTAIPTVTYHSMPISSCDGGRQRVERRNTNACSTCAEPITGAVALYFT